MNRQFYIGAGLMLLLALGVIFWILRKHQAEKNGLQSIIEADKGEITYHLNSLRESVAEARQARASLDQYKQAHPEEVAAILKEFGLRQSQLESYMKASFQARNSGVSVVRHIFEPDTTTVNPNDSISENSFDISDGYLNLHGDTRTEPGLPWLKVNWDYAYQDTISFAGVVKKNGFLGLGKETYWIDATMRNPKSKITSLIDYRVTEFKDKRFSVGPAVILDPFTGTVRVGIGVQYALIKF